MVLEMEMSKTYQYRKVMKPMLERKRRARINKCLDDLKDLMVECLTEEGEHVTRLEKADILELTVEHMKKLKRRGALELNSRFGSTATAIALSSQDCFRSGYVHAADQISKVLATTPGVDVDLGTKLMTYLGQRLNDIRTWSTPMDMPLISTDTKTVGLHAEILGSPTFEFSSQNYTSIDVTNFSYCRADFLMNSEEGAFKIDANFTKEPVWRPW